jgi:hypothetical protein
MTRAPRGRQDDVDAHRRPEDEHGQAEELAVERRCAFEVRHFEVYVADPLARAKGRHSPQDRCFHDHGFSLFPLSLVLMRTSQEARNVRPSTPGPKSRTTGFGARTLKPGFPGAGTTVPDDRFRPAGMERISVSPFQLHALVVREAVLSFQLHALVVRDSVSSFQLHALVVRDSVPPFQSRSRSKGLRFCRSRRVLVVRDFSPAVLRYQRGYVITPGVFMSME